MLFLHHRYSDLPPRDVSGHGNDGIGQDLAVGAGPLAGTAAFNGSTSWVHVLRSKSMDDLRQFQGRIAFRVDPAAPAQRLNLVEGHLSFAIVVNGDRSVSFTIVERSGQWRGCTSVPGVVSPGVWHTLVAAHDGISEARIGLDAQVVARATNVMGLVHSVGALGIAIGRWPDSPAYQFRGCISEVALYKRDPIAEFNAVFAASCIDRKAVAALLGRMAKRLGPEGLLAWARAIQNVLQETVEAIQADQQDTDDYRKRTTAAVIALGTRNGKDFSHAFDAVKQRASQSLRGEKNATIRRRFVELVRQMPFSDNEQQELARALCFDQLA
jgi:hypothetical protein